MNDLTDSENDSSRQDDSRYLKFIELLIDKSTKSLESESFKPRIQDALIAIRLKDKVFKTSEGEKNFWKSIDEMKREMWEEEQPPTDSLESEIKSTILELKDQVENGALPVKSITDTFNQDRSQESQLTYHRVGRILSDMGFRKVRTNTGSYAILWDDNLLMSPASSSSQNELPDFEADKKSESGSPVSPDSPVSPAVCLHPALGPETQDRRKETYTEGLLPPRVFSWSSS